MRTTLLAAVCLAAVFAVAAGLLMHIIKSKLHTDALRLRKAKDHVRIDARHAARRLENKLGLNDGCKGCALPPPTP